MARHLPNMVIIPRVTVPVGVESLREFYLCGLSGLFGAANVYMSTLPVSTQDG